MEKVKKVNGFLVVEFNSREKRDYPDLGTYGVIDPELYTGDLDVDRGALEYDDADALNVALEQARGLGAVLLDEGEDGGDREAVLAFVCDELCKERIPSRTQEELEDICETCALEHLVDKAIAQGPKPEPQEPERDGFKNLAPLLNDTLAMRVYLLGRVLEDDCPANDCRVYLNTFNMAREVDEAIDSVTGHPASVLTWELRRRFAELREMYLTNHAIKQYRKGMKP